MDNQLAYLIPVVAIVGGIVYAIFYQHFRTKRFLAETARTSSDDAAGAETNAAVLDRIAALDVRVAAVENSVNSVP